MQALRVLLLLVSTLLVPGCAAGGTARAVAHPHEDDALHRISSKVDFAGSDLPDVRRFFEVRTATAPSLSPDGRQIAFRTQISGSPQLWVVSAHGGWPKQITFGEPVTFHKWSPAGDWILYGVDRSGDEREGYYLISPDGTRERELLAPSEAFRVFGAFTRDGHRIVYATTQRNGRDFDIHQIDVASGEDREVFRGEMGLYAASVRPDGSAVLLVRARGEDANDVLLYDIPAARLDVLFNPSERAKYGGFEWTPDGRGFFLYTNQDGEHAALAFYDLASRRIEYLERPRQDVEDVALCGDGRYLAWTTNDGGYSALHVRDLSTGKMIPAPALPRGVYEIESAQFATVLSILVVSPQVPGDIWTWNLDSGALARATHSDSAGLDLSRMILPEHHSFLARDGATLHALIYLPPDMPADARPPVLLSLHGGPTSQARPTFGKDGLGPIVQYLLTRGIAVVELNYRGSTGYGKTFARLNDRRLRENELYDLEDAVRWLQTTGQFDTQRVGVTGISYGGYLTMAGLARLPHLWRCGVAVVGVSGWVSALEGASPELQASDRVEYGDIQDPGDREFFRSISPIAYVNQVRAPVLVVHGANDARNPVSQSDQFVDRLRARGVDVLYLRYADEGHLVRRLENRIAMGRRIASFFEQHLTGERGKPGAGP